MRSGVRNNKGFTLTEATIAMIVLSVAAAGVILPFSAGAAMNMEGARRTLGAKLASDYLEEIESYDYAALVEPLPDGYTTSEPVVLDAEWVSFTDDAYSRFARTSTWSWVKVGDEKRFMVTVYIYYDGAEMLRMSRLIGPD